MTSKIRTDLGVKVIQYQSAASAMRVQAEADRALLGAVNGKEHVEAMLTITAKIASANTLTMVSKELADVLISSTSSTAETQLVKSRAKAFGDAAGIAVGKIMALAFVGASLVVAVGVLVWLVKVIAGVVS